MAILDDKFVTKIVCFALCFPASAQVATRLKTVRSVYVGSLGSYPGAAELKSEITAFLKHSRRLQLAQSAAQADVLLEGRGELWARGSHSLSPRARANTAAAETFYSGYLSVKLQGKDGEVLWSYLANPPRFSFGGEVKRQLAGQALNRLIDDIDHAPDPLPSLADPAAKEIAASTSSVAIRGAGATFPYPLYQDWFRSFHAKHPSWTLDYEPLGSEMGLEQLASGQADFAGSDIPPSDSTVPDLRAVPSVGGAVVLIYNLANFNDELQLTADVLADMLAGKIKKWNDPALKALNRHAPLPDAPIELAHRADGSGTTYALTSFLSKTSAAWRRDFGAASRIAWPTGAALTGNEGVAKYVADTPNSFGYVEFSYAFFHHLSIALVQNASGRFLAPSLSSIAAAAENPVTFSISNSPAPNAYPIATFSWLIFKNNLDPVKKAIMNGFIEWMLTSGQKECSALGYAPLPPAQLRRELEIVRNQR